MLLFVLALAPWSLVEYLSISAGVLPQSHTQGTQFFSNHKLHSGPGDHLPVVFQTKTLGIPGLPYTTASWLLLLYIPELFSYSPLYHVLQVVGLQWHINCLCMPVHQLGSFGPWQVVSHGLPNVDSVLQALFSLCMPTHQSQSVLPRRLFPACPATVDSLWHRQPRELCHPVDNNHNFSNEIWTPALGRYPSIPFRV